MTIQELLENPIFNLPLKWENTKDVSFYDYVKNYLTDYLALIKELDNFYSENVDETIDISKTGLLNIVQYFNRNIIEALSSYLSGRPNKAFDEFSKSFEYNGKPIFITEIYNKLPLLFFKSKDDTIKVPFWRLFLKPDDLHNVTKKELFHIPFEELEKIGNNRFSINGFPCLYLGDSIFTCLTELGLLNADFSKVYVSRFTSNYQFFLKGSEKSNGSKKILFLDLSIKTNDMRLKYGIGKADKMPLELFLYLILFPLVSTCSIKVRNPKKNFKPEYIIPQLMLQCFKENRFFGNEYLGIKYSSTKLFGLNSKSNEHYNLVIPPQTEVYLSKGQCPQLEKELYWTEPVTLSYLQEECLIDLEEPFHKMENYLNDKYIAHDRGLTIINIDSEI